MKSIFTLLFICIASFTFAQKKQNIYLLNAKNQIVKEKDSATYYRIIQEPDSGSVLYPVFEFYKNETRKKVGKLSKFESSLVYEGPAITYYPNGKRAAMQNYKDNELVGNNFSFYENGILREQIQYPDVPQEYSMLELKKSKVIQVGDSLGNTFLDDNQTGKVDLSYSSGNKEAGNYKAGLKDGLWKSYDAKTKESYEDYYENGKFIKGKTITSDGNITEYSSLGSLPEFKGGLQAFGSFLGNNLSYPSDDRDNRVQGRVYISFIVEKDGSLSDVKVVRGVSDGINNEALRVINKSPKWIPGLQRGKPVKVSYTVPIVFQLR